MAKYLFKQSASKRKPRPNAPRNNAPRPVARDPAELIEDLSPARRVRLGVVALAIVTALGLVLRTLGFEELTVIAVLAVAGIVLAAISLMALENMGVAVVAMIVMIVTPIAVAIAVDVPLVGPVVETSVGAAPQSSWAAGYRLTDATLRADLAATFTTVRRGRRGAQLYDTFTVAPVVGDGWRQGDPVTVWALASGRTPPPEWSQPRCCLARLLANEKHDEVVERAARRLGLAVIPDRVIGRWVADPADARSQAWGLLVLILGVASIAWIILCALVRPPTSVPVPPRRR